MVWNVQGVGSKPFVTALKDLVPIYKPNGIALVEPHMGGNQALSIASTLGYSGHTRVDDMGFSGEIRIFWKPDIVTVEPIIKHNQQITIDIKRVGAIPSYFTAIYASPDPMKRRELWNELREFSMTHNKPWLIAGDFNDTSFSSKRSSACYETTGRATRFDGWVEEMDLIEVEFVGALMNLKVITQVHGVCC
ncbi:uncharacterized protein [Spinacia oleracea]|uniref:Endonuclease/exonuclease/phosphatase domain-containing protein n=1 Tax=Spinacia oleracea TaxID=3562 RepID=A0ABM3R3J7_SPIOL|nr:uncharacterized protein LOC130465444 [Spinacia oleracea]